MELSILTNYPEKVKKFLSKKFLSYFINYIKGSSIEIALQIVGNRIALHTYEKNDTIDNKEELKKLFNATIEISSLIKSNNMT